MRIRFYLVFIIAVWAGSVYSQGWRKGEMEVVVSVGNPAAVEVLRSLGMNYEPVMADGSSVRMYLIPEEMKRLRESNLSYQVTIPNLNRHYEHFWDNPLVPAGYYTYEEIIAIMDSLATNFPAICQKVSYGTSLGNRQLALLKISDNAGTDETEPEIMFDGGIHGDEVGGSQNVIMFARDLCLAYGTDPAITDMIDNREIWLYPMVNPDGRASMSRYNNNGVDCNRDNGYMWNAEGNSSGAFSQVETKTLRNIILENQFLVYTNYHSGTEIISYPWSYRSSAPRDLAHINHLASVYSAASGYSNLTFGQGYNVMYAINGSTKDYQYGSLGNVGWSVEISMSKQPPASQIGFYYNANKPAMIQLINTCGNGVTGMVTDSLTGQPVRATVWVENFYPVYNDPLVGDYHKYLLPGTYTLKVMANGYTNKTIPNVVVPVQGAVNTDFQLVPANNHFAFKVMSCRIPGNNFGDEGYTPGAIGQPDNVPYALGKNGWIVIDMGDTIFNGNGPDLKVIQSGTVNKSYTVSGGNNMDGPFITIGTGNGTASFDLNAVQLTKVRYLQIKDNGTGSASGPGAGFNLDAIEMLTVPVLADFTATNQAPCANDYIDYQDNSTGNPSTWAWSFPGGTPSFSNAQNPGNIRYDQPGTYDVSLTISNGITTDEETKAGYIVVNPLPVAELGNDTTVCEWAVIQLDAGNPGCSYLWSTGETTQTILADSTVTGYGISDFWVMVTNPAGCIGHDTIHLSFTNCTSLAEAGTTPEIRIIPNPSRGLFVMTFTGVEHGDWKLVDRTGRIVKTGDTGDRNHPITIDATSLPAGIYALFVQKDNMVSTHKVVIVSTP